MMMRKSPLAAAIAAVTLVASAGVASAQRLPANDAPVMAVPNMGNLAPSVVCGVYVEVHITLQNKWANTLPSGTVIQWVLSTGQSGQFVLPVALVPNDAIMIENALSAPVRGRVTCTASVITQAAQ